MLSTPVIGHVVIALFEIILSINCAEGRNTGQRGQTACNFLLREERAHEVSGCPHWNLESEVGGLEPGQ